MGHKGPLLAKRKEDSWEFGLELGMGSCKELEKTNLASQEVKTSCPSQKVIVDNDLGVGNRAVTWS